jgi:succinate dehydrogenase/fumarate reductase flavoprotein subunit
MSNAKKAVLSESRISRREFFKKAGMGVVAGAVAGAVPFRDSVAYAQGGWDRQTDVVVVGTGAAAFSAATTARAAGASVVMLEKAPVAGGTTARSGGGYWIPNNRDLRANGIDDPREDCIRYMARYSFPHLYNPDAENLGLPKLQYDLIATFYDEASPAVEHLAEIGALRSAAQIPGLPDYAEHLPENKVPLGGRTMYPIPGENAAAGGGAEMIRQMQEWSLNHGIEILTGHRASRIVKDDDGAVIGIEASTMNGATLTVHARHGVVFGSGGFTNNREMMLQFQPFGTYGGCAVPSNTGDFVTMASEAGAQLGNMNGAFRLQVVLDQALEFSSILTDIWQPPGDSMILVNKHGARVVNEKRPYNERTRAHYDYDASEAEYPNRFLYMVWDQRSAELYANRFPIPAAGTDAPYVVQGATVEELAANLAAHIDELRPKMGPIASVGAYELGDDFVQGLRESIARFNAFARHGRDGDFGRGSYPYDVRWHSAVFSVPNEGTGHELSTENITMYPMSESGPYYASILVAGTLDTNGGPVIGPNAQVLDPHGQPIPGLYAAGNCVAAPTAHAYWGGGATLGPAVAFGVQAGRHVVREPARDASLASAAEVG